MSKKIVLLITGLFMSFGLAVYDVWFKEPYYGSLESQGKAVGVGEVALGYFFAWGIIIAITWIMTRNMGNENAKTRIDSVVSIAISVLFVAYFRMLFQNIPFLEMVKASCFFGVLVFLITLATYMMYVADLKNDRGGFGERHDKQEAH